MIVEVDDKVVVVGCDWCECTATTTMPRDTLHYNNPDNYDPEDFPGTSYEAVLGSEAEHVVCKHEEGWGHRHMAGTYCPKHARPAHLYYHLLRSERIKREAEEDIKKYTLELFSLGMLEGARRLKHEDHRSRTSEGRDKR